MARRPSCASIDISWYRLIADWGGLHRAKVVMTMSENGGSDQPPATSKSSFFQAFMHRHFPDAKAHDRWQLVFTSVIAISTFLYTVFAGWTLYEIHSGSRDTHDLAVAARDQWRELNESKSYAHESFLWQRANALRPWVGIVDNALSVKEVEPLRKWKVSYRARNYGEVPARRVRTDYRVRTGEIEHWSGSDVCGPDPDLGASDPKVEATTIFPNSDIAFSGFTDPAPQDIVTAKKRWIIVCIAYHLTGKYGTAVIYSLDRSTVFNVEPYEVLPKKN
jgi:hypothetical protein